MNNKRNRPISPHLSIYKPQISSMLSIFHRITGFCLYFASLILIYFFSYIIIFDQNILLTKFSGYLLVKIFIFLVTYAFFYHLSTGVRHLIWDMGKMMDKQDVVYSGIICIISSVLLTMIFWFYIY